MEFPVTTKLLPAQSEQMEHPPIYMKLTPSLLASLRSNPASMTLKINTNASVATLNVGSSVYEGSIQGAPSGLVAYTPQGSDFVSAGRIRHKVALRPSSAPSIVNNGNSSKLPVPEDSGVPTESARSPECSLVAHLLAVGPATAGSLANRLQLPVKTVQTIFTQIGEPSGPNGADLFVLKPSEYQLLNIPSFKHYSTHERRTATENSIQHSNKTEMVSSSKDETPTKLSDSTFSVAQVKRIRKRPIPTDSQLHMDTERQNTPHDKNSHNRRADDGNDMFALARQFRESYSEYRELYSRVRKASAPASQIQQLLAMHRQLERWKRLLWSNSRHRKPVA